MKTLTLMSAYLFLVGAIAMGMASNGFLKNTEGFTRIIPTLFSIFTIVTCIFFLSKAMMVIPVGFTYATYGALTITGVTLIGALKYNQTPNMHGVAGIIFIIIGVILLNTLGKLK